MSAHRLWRLAALLSLLLILTACGEDDESDDPTGNNDVDASTDADNGDEDDASDADEDGGSSTEEAAVDTLWVIDNSGSMCEEQEALRENFEYYADTLVDNEVDFHIGVTTTQMVDSDKFPLEKVARPGHIQAVPQPVPSQLPACHGEEGNDGDGTDGYEPIRASIETAVDSCTKDPDQWQDLKDVTNDEIDCHLTEGCDEDDEKMPHELFPVTEDGEQPTWETPAEDSPYREIPLVLRAEDYEDEDGDIDRDQLEDDFACMSLVGTGGYAVEEGLHAATEAVSPEMTGGTVENPSDDSAPNHGLIREEATFSTVFVTDENDCSGIGDAVDGICGSSVCSYANHPDTEDSPLDATADLADEFRNNLEASKGGEADPVMASIHGAWQRYGEDPDNPGDPDDAMTAEDCEDLEESPPEESQESPSCDNDRFGTAFSGDRYERFLDEFDSERVFPEKREGEEHLEGLICHPNDVPATLEGLASTISESAGGG